MLPATFISGTDTATPLNLAKRIGIISRYVTLQTRALDIGCASGEYAAALQPLVRSVVGIDTSADRFAKSRPEVRTHLQVGYSEDLPFANESFDLILLNEVLEHVRDDAATLREAFRVLSPGGRLVLMSPNRLFPFEQHSVFRNGRTLPTLHTVMFPYLPIPLHRHFGLTPTARNYWPWQLRSLVRGAGFTIEQTSFVAQTMEGKGAVRFRHTGLLRKALEWGELLPLFRSFLCISTLVVGRKS